MTRQRVALEDALPQPWRNGGGSTQELLAWPAAGAWQLRVSVAEIARDGPFSRFPDIERWFAVLEGAGVVLNFAQGERTLTVADEPLRFVGEAAPGCRLIKGPTLDLNLMAQRSAGTPLMRRAVANECLSGSTRWRAVFAAEPVLMECDGVTEALAEGELLWSDDCGADRWRLRGAGRCWFMALHA